MKERQFKYFKRDISWLSFNKRVLMEADDASLPVYERIKFLSIYASNLEEFYEVRVSEHRGDIMKKNYADESAETSEESLESITNEVNNQQKDFYRIFNCGILPELQRQGIYLYQNSVPMPFHADFVLKYFKEEVYPFLAPVTIQDGARTFLRDRRIYLLVKLLRLSEPQYVLIRIPFSKVPRFIPLPDHDGKHYYMFVDDVIRIGLEYVFYDFKVEGCYSIKISRDNDIYIDDANSANNEVIKNELRKKVNDRKIGALSRFMYDSEMPQDMLDYVRNKCDIATEDLVVGGRYMNLQDMATLPNPVGEKTVRTIPSPMAVKRLDNADSIINALKTGDILLHLPYQSFEYLIKYFREAAYDPDVEEIKITQYRVAENSAVIDSLVDAAKNGKQVTVFVELKARFDETNNLSTAERMEQAGVKIIYSIPGLKVHAKVAVVLRRGSQKDSAYLGTGNLNEKTARIYSDLALLTCNADIVRDVNVLFDSLERLHTERNKPTPTFSHLLITPFNMLDEIKRLIEREKEHVKQGRRGYIILKMNGLHDKGMIDTLYEASLAGVEIDLIIRGICCLVPQQPYSRNIRITRLVDMFLEHSRVWYFYNNGTENVYLTSSDWMRRNINRRIEVAFPVLDPDLRRRITDILQIQLRDNVKACYIDENLNNIYKRDARPPVRAQEEIFAHNDLLITAM
ncbi:MAG: polyphosphate kinase 1 [Tannerella sp.]|nr:polyphosphate kinase 1 [Tannerella sp.]